MCKMNPIKANLFAKRYSDKPAGKIFPYNVDKIRNRKCVSCDEDANEFRNEISLKEYGISGLCQICQDLVFGVKK